ncbi:Crp/Fnr family transcriptional regulator [Flectobacillus roseus]|uniref:Crp/Fnr family transcriptional regulator n=1 Tax=Flectobacillus roseus TaxID=502259 RepID=A0ABT6Y738_9BACT|nr:Crp/Fnr family transcriptional regulator [Flectobacillus roseus]MDI9859387.1 Crp/Fnr family transcriptional regulator [Flectobacillus roseus]
MDLLQFFNNKLKFTDEENEVLSNAFKVEIYAKGTTVVQPNSFVKKVYFVERGLLRCYYYKEGKDITHFFFDEDTFTAPLNSVFYNKEEAYGWETLEETTLRVIQYDDLQDLFIKYPSIQRFFFGVSLDILNAYALKLEYLQFYTAEERYANLLETNPGILHRTSLGHIASYLGITQQTLSVIRGKK